MRTRFTERYSLEIPFVGAPLGELSGPDLTAAVSEAGGMGTLGAVGVAQTSPARLRALIRVTRSLTKRPFGVNFVAPLASDELIEICVEERVSVVSFHLGETPSHWVARLRLGGVDTWVQVGSPEAARAAVEAGAVLVVAQGQEAGGCIAGVAPTLSLLPAIVDAVFPALVLAAGGIADGRGMVAAIALGADGVWVGTRLIASDEAYADAAYKRCIIAARPGDTELTPSPDVPGVPSGLGIRTLRPRKSGSWRLGLLAGESAALVHDVRPAVDIVRHMHASARDLITNRLAGCLAPREGV
jgi:NAD(P)H-dependent flavin oxidoreductase YrpB (nitropropane dioxygenase family)